jgi:hypothetical protein
MEKETKSTAVCYLVSFDFADNGDVKIAIVGRQNENKAIEVVNAFAGEEAAALYKKLTTKRPKGD